MPPKKPTDKATRLNAQKRPVHEERDETNSDVSYTQEETDLEESDSDEEGSEVSCQRYKALLCSAQWQHLHSV